MSSLKEERREQERWKRVQLRPKPIYDTLVEHDFETPEEHRVRQGKNLDVMLRFAAHQVPHYSNLFRTIGVELGGGEPFETLNALPVMTKLDAQDAGNALFARNLLRPVYFRITNSPLWTSYTNPGPGMSPALSSALPCPCCC